MHSTCPEMQMPFPAHRAPGRGAPGPQTDGVRERTVVDTTQDWSPPYPSAAVKELIDVDVIPRDVVGAEIHRTIGGCSDTATDVLRYQSERTTTVMEPSGTGRASNSSTNDDDRPIRTIQCLPRATEMSPLTLHTRTLTYRCTSLCRSVEWLFHRTRNP